MGPKFHEKAMETMFSKILHFVMISGPGQNRSLCPWKVLLYRKQGHTQDKEEDMASRPRGHPEGHQDN